MKTTSIAALIVLACGAAAADQGRVEIGPTDTFPIVIDEPGSYVLTADLHVGSPDVTGISVTADNVSLDLGGHVVSGSDPSGSSKGIHSGPVSGFVVFNGHVTGFNRGISMQTAPVTTSGGNRFHDLTISHCGRFALSFYDGAARNISVQGNGFVSSINGAVFCGNCTLTDVTAKYNQIGITVSSGSATNCAAVENLGDGIQLYQASLTGGSAKGNGGNGVTMFRSVVTGVTSTFNDGWGFDLGSGNGNNLVNCTGSDNDLGNQTGCGDGSGCHQNYLP